MREGQKRSWFIAAFSVTLFMVAGGTARAQDVSTNAMPGINFGKYHSYKWVSLEGVKYPNQIVDAQIKEAVDLQLQAKGFTKTSGETADMFVAYQVAIDQEKEWNAFGMGGGRFGGMGQATSSTVSNGTLVLDFYDPTSKQLVWQGRATKTLNSGMSSDKVQKNLDSAMKKLMKSFPPK